MILKGTFGSLFLCLLNSNMKKLPVRRLLDNFKDPFPGRWNGGDPFRSAVMNAFSMGFPIAEQYFIYTLKQSLRTLSEKQRESFESEIKGFIGQEAMHSIIHKNFNQNLLNLGYKNLYEKDLKQEVSRIVHRDLKTHLAATAAIEHIAAMCSMWLLNNQWVLDGAEDKFKTMWLWHCAEETEHRNVGFDVFKMTGGTEKIRILTYLLISIIMFKNLTMQTIHNLHHDKSLFKLSTWKTGYKIMLSKNGLVRFVFKHWLKYFSSKFHPSQLDGLVSEKWLENNNNNYMVIA